MAKNNTNSDNHDNGGIGSSVDMVNERPPLEAVCKLLQQCNGPKNCQHNILVKCVNCNNCIYVLYQYMMLCMCNHETILDDDKKVAVVCSLHCHSMVVREPAAPPAATTGAPNNKCVLEQ